MNGLVAVGMDNGLMDDEWMDVRMDAWMDVRWINGWTHACWVK